MTVRPRLPPKPVQFTPAERDLVADLIECRQATMKIVDREDSLMAARIKAIAKKLAEAKT